MASRHRLNLTDHRSPTKWINYPSSVLCALRAQVWQYWIYANRQLADISVHCSKLQRRKCVEISCFIHCDVFKLSLWYFYTNYDYFSFGEKTVFLSLLICDQRRSAKHLRRGNPTNLISVNRKLNRTALEIIEPVAAVIRRQMEDVWDAL